MSKKEKFEQLILASPLFSLDKERDISAYSTETKKMVGYLYNYLFAINESRYYDYALEITQTAKNCIEKYDPKEGNFLHYFNSAMAKEYRRTSIKRSLMELRNGIHLSAEDDKNIRKLLKLMKSKSILEPTSEHIEMMAEVLDVSVDTVINTIRTLHDTTVISDVVRNDDGEEISLFDTVASDGTADSDLMSKEECAAVLSQIEDAYLSCQDRQKPILSAMLTARICETICNLKISVEKYSFVEKDIITTYIKRGTLPTQRDIAAMFGKDEASVSRTLKEFLKKIKKIY